MSAQAAVIPHGRQGPDPTFNLLVQHWAQARIDAPIDVIAWLDDAGKQLVTVGAVLQGLYVALFATNLFKGQISGKPVIMMSVSLGLVMVFAALAVCAVQVKFDVATTFDLFNGGQDSPDGKLMDAIHQWCCSVRNTVKYKRRLLATAKVFLCLNFLASVYVLSRLMWI